MGEYAKRKSDNVEVKIGTCEQMLYLRLEDCGKVEKIPHSLDPSDPSIELFFRLPFPDEDNTPIGEYNDPFRLEPLYQIVEGPPYDRERKPTRHSQGVDDLLLTDSEPGIVQLRNEGGMMINAPCYHGRKLPDAGECKVFWNGRANHLALAFVKRTAGGNLKPIVQCRYCRDMWRFDWADVLPYVHGEMKNRLAVYARPELEAITDQLCGNTFTHLYAV